MSVEPMDFAPYTELTNFDLSTSDKARGFELEPLRVRALHNSKLKRDDSSKIANFHSSDPN